MVVNRDRIVGYRGTARTVEAVATGNKVSLDKLLLTTGATIAHRCMPARVWIDRDNLMIEVDWRAAFQPPR
jgi:hypothetical protein